MSNDSRHLSDDEPEGVQAEYYEYDEDDDFGDESSGGWSIWAWLGIAAVIVLLFPAVIFGVSYATTDVPEPDELANNQISVIYRSDGSELGRIVPENGNRRPVPLESVPDQIRNAVLAAEDREFYTNPGFSLSGYARAAWGVITGNPSLGGGSTITQQYVKNAVVGNERTVTRKFRELVMSAKMAQEWSKDQILEAYLNTIYFGRNAYGIAAAADAYFHKPVEELTVEEGAVLAAAIQRPSELDPWVNRPEAEHRWDYVMDGLVEMNVLSPNKRATAQYPETRDPATIETPQQIEGADGLIRKQVMAELGEEGITETEVATQGLRITTTIDPVVQQAALDAVDANVNKEGGQRAAVVSIEPETGAVRAYYGGDDPNGWDFAGNGVQTGSTFKIVTLAAALAQGIPLSREYSSAPYQSGSATINNVGGASCGVCPIHEALRQSLNTPFFRLQDDLEHEADDTAAMGHKLGIAESIPGINRTLMEDNGHSFDGITLGQYPTRPLDMAVALSTLTADGVYHKPHFVDKVETAGGEVLLDRGGATPGEERVSKAVATNVIDAMGPIASYSGKALAGGRPSAAKTGTTQLGDTGLNKDAWMIGSTPQLATAVWMGMVDSSALYNSYGGVMYGANGPGSIWKQMMDTALSGEDFEYFSDPLPIAGVAGRTNWAPSTMTITTETTEESTTEESTSESSEPSHVPGLDDLLPPGVVPGEGGNGGGGTGGGGQAPPDPGTIIEEIIPGA